MNAAIMAFHLGFLIASNREAGEILDSDDMKKFELVPTSDPRYAGLGRAHKKNGQDRPRARMIRKSWRALAQSKGWTPHVDPHFA
jgi:hypothetical protein